MIYFTKYATKKFDILNKHNVFVTKEEVEDTVKLPNKSTKKGKYLFMAKEGVGVVLKKEDGMDKVITFYPIRQKS